MNSIINFLKKRKVAIIIILILFAVGGYYGYQKIWGTPTTIRYATSQVKKGMLIVSVSGSGQVSASNQVDLKPKVSGTVLSIGVSNGKNVSAGEVVVRLDSTDASKAVRDAEVNLESAKLSLEKLNQPADSLSVMQAENTIAEANDSKQKAESDLAKAYEDGFNTVANTFLDLPTIMTGLDAMFFKSGIVNNQQNISWYADQIGSTSMAEHDKALLYKDDVLNSYDKALDSYNKNFSDYKGSSRSSSKEVVEALILETYETTKDIADAVKNSSNYIDYVKDIMTKYNFNISSAVATHQSNLNSYTGTTNNHLLSLLSIKQTIEDSKKAIINADKSIIEKGAELEKLKAGTDILDLQSSELSIKQRENALLDAKEKLSDYTVRAPFSGVFTGLQTKLGDSLSSGTLIGTLITKQKIAEISLNEVDIVKIKIGQKATLSFDAVDGLSITGKVAEIDALGTVAQGVVNYGVKIAFDTNDERIKPGMSISANIIVEAKQNILLVPSGAIKTNGSSYVETVTKQENDSIIASASDTNTSDILVVSPVKTIVEVGSSNDESTEIISGLKEGDYIITQTTTTATSTAKTTQSSSLRIPGIGGGGMGR